MFGEKTKSHIKKYLTRFRCGRSSGGSRTMQILMMTAKNLRIKSLMPTYQTRSYNELTLPIDKKTALEKRKDFQ